LSRSLHNYRAITSNIFSLSLIINLAPRWVNHDDEDTLARTANFWWTIDEFVLRFHDISEISAIEDYLRGESHDSLTAIAKITITSRASSLNTNNRNSRDVTKLEQSIVHMARVSRLRTSKIRTITHVCMMFSLSRSATRRASSSL